MKIKIRLAKVDDIKYSSLICKEIEDSAKSRGTGIAKRDPEYIKNKMISGNSIIAFYDQQIAGFSYIEVFQKMQFVANSGLIVFPKFRKLGLAKMIKLEIFKLSRKKFPKAKIISITTNPGVIKMNTELGFDAVTFNKLTNSENFWKGCKSCSHYDVLTRNKRKMCLCTGLLYDSNKKNISTNLTKGDNVVLAYSGGLDTSFCLKFLSEKGYKVNSVIVNTGGFNYEELEKIKIQALKFGCFSHYTIDAKNSYYNKCIKYLIYGNIFRNGNYPLSVSAERIFQAVKIAEYAKKINAKAIAHGSTGAGNDQIRFDLVFQIICPEKIIITPIRDNKISRKQEIKYLQSHGINLTWEKAQYSINKGLWGITIGGAETLTSHQNLPNNAFTNSLKKTKERIIEIGFEKGEFVTIDGQKNTPINNIEKLENIASEYAIGRDIHVGDTIIGIKGRIGFEASAALIIIKCHHLLEKHVLTKWQLYWKDQLSNWYGMLLHEAQYLDPVMRNIENFLENTQKRVNGKIKVSLYPYRFELIGIRSEFDMMQSKNAQYGEMNNICTSEDIKGFIKILGNQMKIYHDLEQDFIND